MPTDSHQDEYDFVVVGAGASAMGLLYGMLSPYKESKCPFTVAVVERGGGPPHDSSTLDPSDWGLACSRPSRSVDVIRTPIRRSVFDVPIGKGIGGTTNVNACLVTPPAADDFVTWPSPWRQSMLSSVHKVQDVMRQHKTIINNDSGVVRFPPPDPLSATKWRQTDFPSTVSPVPAAAERVSDKEYRRLNYFDGILKPFLVSHPHLKKQITWYTGTMAERLLFQEDRVVGVECNDTTTKRLFPLCCRREVVLCAGAIESPALLLASGIGLPEDLAAAEIVPRKRQSGLPVGRNLRDHVMLPRAVLAPWGSYSRTASGIPALRFVELPDGDRFQYMLTDATPFNHLIPYHVAKDVRIHTRGLLAPVLNPIFECAFQCLKFCLWALARTPLLDVLRYCTVCVNIVLLNPKSKGQIRLRRIRKGNDGVSRRSDFDLVIDLGYLTDERDIRALERGFEVMDEQCKDWLIGTEVMPGQRYRNPLFGSNWFRTYCCNHFAPYYHWCGTCAMGDESSVVDGSLRLRDYKGVRVCDASVLPSLVSNPTALTCASLGLLFARELLKAV